MSTRQNIHRLNDKDKMIKLAYDREYSYGFISSIFKEELKSDQIDELISNEILESLVNENFNIDLGHFENTKLEHLEEELACEYAALFIGPGKHIPPYESIYAPDKSGKVGSYWGECTVDMKNWVEKSGLTISEKFDSIPDHISLEFEFMQKIIEQERLSREKDNLESAMQWMSAAKTFFEKHLIEWVPKFCDDVIELANIDFYREIAKLTKSFILEEKEFLTNLAPV